MNLASALLYQVLNLEDFDTWSNIRRHYLPSEYHQLYDVISKHVDKFHKLPKMEELKLIVRDSATLDKVYALETIDTEAEPFLLLEYLKNEYAQKEVFFELDRYIENSIAFDSAEEVIKNINRIAIEVESKIELGDPAESMQKISLFDSEEEIEGRITLGLNEDFDKNYQFAATDYILMGGERGSGKSITCNNVCRHIMDTKKKKTLYYSIEMPSRQVLQRDAAIATRIPFFKIRNRNLNQIEWQKLAAYWATRFRNSEKHYEDFLKHQDFNKYHAALSREELSDVYLDVIYDPALTLGKFRSEVEKRLLRDEQIGALVVDYVNQVVRHDMLSVRKEGQFDWKEQVQVSKALKQAAQDYGIPVFSPYQVDKGHEARFAKGILDSADAAMTLKASENSIKFTVTKMRNADDEVIFASEMDWMSLKIGPASVTFEDHNEDPKKGFGTKKASGGEGIYDDDPF